MFEDTIKKMQENLMGIFQTYERYIYIFIILFILLFSIKYYLNII